MQHWDLQRTVFAVQAPKTKADCIDLRHAARPEEVTVVVASGLAGDAKSLRGSLLDQDLQPLDPVCAYRAAEQGRCQGLEFGAKR